MSDIGLLAPMFTQLVTLEQQAAAAMLSADPADSVRVYPWRPPQMPQLPAIWNWIDDGSYEIVDTARADDLVVVTATIGVKPTAQLDQTLDRLVRLTDTFRQTVDPALHKRPVLGGTARAGKRVVTRTNFDDFNDVPVMCMDMLIQVQLSRFVV